MITIFDINIIVLFSEPAHFIESMPERIEVTEARPLELRCRIAGRPFPSGI